MKNKDKIDLLMSKDTSITTKIFIVIGLLMDVGFSFLTIYFIIKFLHHKEIVDGIQALIFICLSIVMLLKEKK
jgi:Na+/melibiose symporter-like transporter